MRNFLPILALLALFTAATHGGKKPAKPQIPYGGSPAVFCDPVVVRQFNAMWQVDEDGRADGGTLEYGFRIDWVNGHIEVGPLIRGKDYSVSIPTSLYTIAIAHTHPERGVSSPSSKDMQGDYPDYVVSRDGLWVTRVYVRGFDWLRPYTDQFSTKNCPYVKPVKKKKLRKKTFYGPVLLSRTAVRKRGKKR